VIRLVQLSRASSARIPRLPKAPGLSSVSRPIDVGTRCEDCSVTVVVQWLGPVLLFFAAMITLWVTNYRADIREWNKWRRNTLREMCSDALAAAREAEAMCESALSHGFDDEALVVSDAFFVRHQLPRRVFVPDDLKPGARWESEGDRLFQDNLASASKAAARIGTIADQLSVIGATNYLTNTCARLKDAADAINLPASHLRWAQKLAARQQLYEWARINSEGEPFLAKGSPEQLERDAKIVGVYQRIHQENMAEPETRYNDARGQLEAVRKLFIERGLIELRSTST
jgi:hypothetical protein